MQILYNLQSNAVKFTNSGFVKVSAEIIEQDFNKFLDVTVEDSGCGIRQEDQAKLFSLFGFIVNKNKLRLQGSGLGLIISQKIVEQFEGSIYLESTPGKGSKFSFKVKLENEDSEISIGSLSLGLNHHHSLASLGREVRLLIVDDEPFN